MNALQTMATIFLSMALVSMGGAISSFIGKVDSWQDADMRQILVAGLFLALFFLLRIKMYLDDLEILGGTGKFVNGKVKVYQFWENKSVPPLWEKNRL